MAKRFTDTRKWEDPWYQDLSPEMKCVWGFILDHCDNAGVWVVNTKLMCFQIGVKVSLEKIKSVFGNRLNEFADGKIWVPKFIEFQYGKLSESCLPHKKVFELLKAHGIFSLYEVLLSRVPTRVVENIERVAVRVVTTLQEEEEDKDKEEEEEKEEDQDLRKGDARGKPKQAAKLFFDEARKLYPGTKRSLDVEWENFRSKNPDYENILPILAVAIQKEIEQKAVLRKTPGAFCPDWKMLSTWINQRCWTQEFGEIIANQKPSFGSAPASREQLEINMQKAFETMPERLSA